MAQMDTMCQSITQYLKANRSSSMASTIVFRCRPVDNCGGLGDRMAGLASAAFIAFLTKRSFKVDFPGLQMCFGSLGLPVPVGTPLEYPPVDINTNLQLIPINGCRGESVYDRAMVNALNEAVDFSFLSKLEPYRTVYYHSNRGVSPRLLPPEADSQIPVWHLNHCILRSLFLNPLPQFLNQTVELLGGQTMTPYEMTEVLQSSAHTSVGIHVRLSDKETRMDETALRDQLAETVRLIDSCVFHLSKQHMVVYLSSNSVTLGDALLAKYGPNSNTRVIVSKPAAIRHINFKEWHTKFRNSSSPGFYSRMNSAVARSVVDFFMLSRTKVLIFFSC
eukprot:TRINITY_DN16555_c0_g1_i1.p1 TRINITY_DN16555_c0_g1~~TRINITY_DN16555_c0_g1_i1.p1  ORF type:complete len:367 (-),score=8.14 TRINITY_DN16555_c0_g1_i1:224-1225(-)